MGARVELVPNMWQRRAITHKPFVRSSRGIAYWAIVSIGVRTVDVGVKFGCGGCNWVGVGDSVLGWLLGCRSLRGGVCVWCWPE